MLKFAKIISLPNQTNIGKENGEYLKNIPLVEMNVSKLINYLTDMCWNGHGTLNYEFPFVFKPLHGTFWFELWTCKHTRGKQS